MAALEKIRSRAGILISVIIGIALISFLVNPQDIINYFQSSRNNVGEINGKKIDIQEFQRNLDQNSYMFSMLYANTPTSQQDEMAREKTWADYIQRFLLDDQYEKVGISVSSTELKELATGKILSPILKGIPDFYDAQTNQANWENLTAFWKNEFGSNEQRASRQAMIVYFEQEIKQERLNSKYNSLIEKADYINNLEIKRATQNSARSVEFSYVKEPFIFGNEADSLYRVKESEAKEYYNKHKRSFEQEESRDIEMVVFPVLPSSEDEANARNVVEELAKGFATAENLEQFVKFNSDAKSSFDYKYYKKGELAHQLDSFAFSASKEDIMQPILDGDMFKIARINDVRMLPDSINLRWIILQPTTQEQASNPNLLMGIADSIVKVLQTSNSWNELALQYSADQQTSFNGGEVGWRTQDQLPLQFVEATFLSPTGKITSIPTQEGIYIIQADKKTKDHKKVQLATISKEVTAGRNTYDEIYNKANKLASESLNNAENFNKLVAEYGLTKQTAPNVQRASKKVNSLNNAKPLVSWAYGDDIKEGNVSGVIDIDNSHFVVATVTTIREEGIAPFSQKKNEIGVIVQKEKQAKVLEDKMKAALSSATSIDDVAGKLNATVQFVAEPTTFSSYSIAGLGFEPSVAAAAASISELNKPSQPIVGESGVFVLAVTAERNDDGYTEEMARYNVEQMRGMNPQFAQYARMIQMQVLYKSANVKDMRARFY